MIRNAIIIGGLVGLLLAPQKAAASDPMFQPYSDPTDGCECTYLRVPDDACGADIDVIDDQGHRVVVIRYCN